MLEGLEDRTVPTVEVLSAADPLLGNLPGNDTSQLSSRPGVSVSQDGRYVVFQSQATNLVANQADTADTWDVFLRDRVANSTILLSRSHSSATAAGDGESRDPSLSVDGRFVVFQSKATNLVANQSDASGTWDVFLYDRVTASVSLVSHLPQSATTTGNAESLGAAISADGSSVAYTSRATNLVTGQSDTNAEIDVFLYDRASGANTLISQGTGSPVRAGNGASDRPTLDAAGRFVAFQSAATNLAAGQDDHNGLFDVFVYDHSTGITTLVSHASDSEQTAATGESLAPVISSDGNFIAFTSYSDNLVTGQNDFNLTTDLFLHDRTTGANSLISHAGTSAVDAGDNYSDAPALSADGRFLAYRSAASNLVDGQADGNDDLDVYLFDRLAGTTTLVSHVAGNSPVAGNAFSDAPTISADGNRIAFASLATNLVETATDVNGVLDVFLYYRTSGAVSLLSHQAGSETEAAAGLSDSPRFSAGGGMVVFQSSAADLADGDGGASLDVFSYVLPNLPPVVVISGPTTIAESGTLTLGSMGTHDPDETPGSMTYEWDLDGDGSFGETGQDALHGDEVGPGPIFSAAGLDGPLKVAISLRVSDGGAASTVETVMISVVNVAPSVNAGEPYSVLEGANLTLAAAAIDVAGALDPLTFTWDLDGDGLFGELGFEAGRGDETGPGPTFSAAGLDGPATFTVALRVEDGDGGLTSQEVAIAILNAPPTVTPDGPFSVLEGGSVSLSATATDGAGVLDPLAVSWDLDADGLFGETGTAAGRGNEAGTNVAFSALGLDGPRSFTVRVRANDGDGGVVTKALVIDVANVPPVLDSGGPYSVLEGGTVALTASATDVAAAADPLTLAWDLDGDGLFGETGTKAGRGDELGASVVFSAAGLDGPGDFTIQARVADGDGGITTQDVPITLLNAPPTALIGGPYIVLQGETLALYGSATDPGGDTLTFQWDLDQDGIFGETGSLASNGDERGPQPNFSAAGLTGPATVPIQLRVSDDDGHFVTRATTITIQAPPPPLLPPSLPSLQRIQAKVIKVKGSAVLNLINSTTGQIFNHRLALRYSAGGYVVKIGDVNGDGAEDAVVMLRKQAGPIKVFDGSRGNLLGSIPSGVSRKMLLNGRINIQMGDRDGNGSQEISLRGKIGTKRRTLVYVCSGGRLVRTA